MRRLVPLLLLLIHPPAISAQKTAAQSLKEANELYRKGDQAGARRLLEQTIDLAVQEKDTQVEADAQYYWGASLRQSAQYEASGVHLRAALSLFEQLGNRFRQAETYTELGIAAWATGKPSEARSDFEKALALHAALENWAGVATQHRNLAFVSSGAEHLEHLQLGLELARKAGARRTEAMLLHSLADYDYGSDDFNAAFDHLNQARSILEEVGDRNGLARVLTSIGRLYRVHGHADQAFLFYQRARDIQKEIGDVQGEIQSLQAMGVALNNLSRSAEALRYDQEALQLGRGSGSPLIVQSILHTIAESQLFLGRYAEAAAVLEEARQMARPDIPTFNLLSAVRFHLGQYEAAWKAAEEGLALEAKDSGELARAARKNRAQALWKLGKTQEALRDVRQLMESTDQARAKLVPTDFMKQGYADTDRGATSLSIHVLLDGGEEREALETAERARSRAFLDLLATKSIAPNPFSAQENDGALPFLLTRGGSSPATPPALPSRASAATASVEDALALACRLDSTVVAYWVDDSSTIIWVVSPEGRIAHAQTDRGTLALDQRINEALRSLESPSEPARVQIAARGGATLLARRDTLAAWRQLYDALIRPVRSSLPSKSGSRLTIIPSGPLFRLSFAALRDEKGRYLIEKYALNYSPAIEVFRYTRRAQQRTFALPPRYLLVANPSGMPSADGKALPALPASDKEVQSISRLVPPGSTVVLRGKQADEASVREAMPAAKVIHLATHGVIDNSNPLGSFLALGRTNSQPNGDGRLTAEEVYALDLHADLVVLSACRTGLGRISGDGVAGLARAFFYAGTASVVSTLWDVADEPAAQLIADFYRSLGKGGMNGKSEALRDAQLHLLHALRNGEVRVDTPLGKLSLPEDPVLWAGYVLFGEPQ